MKTRYIIQATEKMIEDVDEFCYFDSVNTDNKNSDKDTRNIWVTEHGMEK